jgi:signal transduction histidine kinase
MRTPWNIVALFLLSVLLPFALFAAVALDTRGRLFAEARRDAEATAEVLRAHATKVFETQELVLDTMEDMVRGTPDEVLRRPEASARLAALAARLEQTVSLWIADAEGSIVAASLPWSPALNVAETDYFRAQIEGPVPRFVGTPFVGRTTGMPSFSMSRRRPAEDGRFAGTLHVAVSPRYFEENFRLADRGAGAAALLREDGVVLARNPPAERGARLGPDSPMRRALEEGQMAGVITGVSSLDGTPRLYAFRRIGPFPVYVGYGVDMPARLAAWRQGIARYGLAALASALLLSAATWLAWRSAASRASALSALQAEAERRHRAETRLQEARSLEALGRMARGVAHDFNNLLTVVIGNLETLEEIGGDAAARGAATRARKAAEAGAQLATSLLAYARTQVLRIEPVAVDALLRDLHPVLQDLATPAVPVTLDLQPGLPRCLVDVAQLRAAIGNLVSNARDAMPDGGRIRIVVDVAAEAPPGRVQPGGAARFVRIGVRDTGSGMPPEVAQRACEPFFTTKHGGGGSGLGLSQVFGLMHQLGGHVALDSAAGHGTEVTLHLPVAPESAEAATPPGDAAGPPAAPPCPSGRRILVVDDQPEIRALARAMLSRAGHAVSTASGGQEALALLGAQDRFDLVLTDIVMPGDLDRRRLPAPGAHRPSGRRGAADVGLRPRCGGAGHAGHCLHRQALHPAGPAGRGRAGAGAGRLKGVG